MTIGKGYLATIVALMLVLPAVSMVVDRVSLSSTLSWWELGGKWFTFWGVGVRLASAGARQVAKPGFTARDIFHLSSPDADVIVRELGFANICMGLGAIISGFAPSWRLPEAFIGGLYFGIAGVMHVIKKPVTPNEKLALGSDLFIFAVVAAYVIHTV